MIGHANRDLLLLNSVAVKYFRETALESHNLLSSKLTINDNGDDKKKFCNFESVEIFHSVENNRQFWLLW